MSNFRGIVPSVDDADNLGWSSLRWVKGWFKDLFCNGVLTDGTTSHSVADLRDALKIKGKPIDTPTTDKTYARYNSTEGEIEWHPLPVKDTAQYDFQTSISTTSTNLIDIQDLTHTTAAGATRTYHITLSLEHKNTNADKVHTFAIVVDGVEVTSRQSQTDKSNLSNETTVHWLGTVAPGKVIKAQFSTNANTLTATKRTMIVWGEE